MLLSSKGLVLPRCDVSSRLGGATRAAAVRMDGEVRRFEVCRGKYCSKKGSKKTLALLEELATGVDGVLVEKADMSHTEHGCFDECPMGPNVRVDGAGPQTDGGRILNGIRGIEACAELLGVSVPEPAAAAE